MAYAATVVGADWANLKGCPPVVPWDDGSVGGGGGGNGGGGGVGVGAAASGGVALAKPRSPQVLQQIFEALRGESGLAASYKHLLEVDRRKRQQCIVSSAKKFHPTAFVAYTREPAEDQRCVASLLLRGCVAAWLCGCVAAAWLFFLV